MEIRIAIYRCDRPYLLDTAIILLKEGDVAVAFAPPMYQLQTIIKAEVSDETPLPLGLAHVNRGQKK